MKELLERTKLTSAMVDQIEGLEIGTAGAIRQPLSQFLKRPEITIEKLVATLHELDPQFFRRPSTASHQPARVGFRDPKRTQIHRDRNQVRGLSRPAATRHRPVEEGRAAPIPEWFDYHSVSGLSREMQETLRKVQPQTLGQASRIPGVTPAAVSLVNVYIEIQSRRREQPARR